MSHFRRINFDNLETAEQELYIRFFEEKKIKFNSSSNGKLAATITIQDPFIPEDEGIFFMEIGLKKKKKQEERTRAEKALREKILG